MAAFHIARLLLAQHKPEEARPFLDRLVTGGEAQISPSALNLVKALRLPLARSREELVTDLQRIPVGIEWPDGESETPPDSEGDPRLVASWPDAVVAIDHAQAKRFLEAYGARPPFLQGDGAWILNERVPLSLLVELARAPQTAPHLRREWLRCAWVRAILLGQTELAASLSPELRGLEPELQAPLAAFEQVPAAQREREAVWILLHHPGLRWFVSQSLNSRTYRMTGHKNPWQWERGGTLKAWHPFRDSWWPSLEELEQNRTEDFWFGCPGPFAYAFPLEGLLGSRRSDVPVFLDAVAGQRLAEEQTCLRNLENGPAWLCRKTAEWAKAEPQDARLPEALHYAVKASRVDDANPWVKTCFRTLHSRYPRSSWAEKTPYYY